MIEMKLDVRSNLKLILDERNMSIRQLAEDSGLKFETVRRLYHDKTVQYHRESIAAICKTLDIDVSELLILDEKAE
jgi:putative transcriptional regulator